MEGEEIGPVLVQASELRAKISDCIDSRCNGTAGGAACEGGVEAAVGEEETEEEDEESLISIRDALDSLEHQLAAMQALQQQQRYEREATLAQIDRSRKMLLSKLKEYKREDLDVIREASAFVGEAIDHEDNLLLPPYPTDLPNLFVSEDIFPSLNLLSRHKFVSNGLINNLIHRNKGMDESDKMLSTLPSNKASTNGIRFVVGLAMQSVITFLGVISALNLAGMKPRSRKGCTQFSVLPEKFW